MNINTLADIWECEENLWYNSFENKGSPIKHLPTRKDGEKKPYLRCDGGVVVRHGIITAGDHDSDKGYVFLDLRNSRMDDESQTLYDVLIEHFHLSAQDERMTERVLFERLCRKFDEKYGIRLDVEYSECYIVTSNESPAPHNEMPRVFSKRRLVYIDVLMLSVLTNYAMVFYLWALKPDDTENYGFCFRYAMYLFNELCRKGHLPGTEGSERIMGHAIKQMPERGIHLAMDLYWCMVAFAMCHELAHIYLGHGEGHSEDERFAQEYEADAAGYEVFLSLVVAQAAGTGEPDWRVFHEYLYAAPMIMFLFYDCLFTMCFWVFGEQIIKTHPSLGERIDRLLAISAEERFVFDSSMGNQVLNHYWEIADVYKEELFYKLIHGKLEEICRKGASFMVGNGYEDAYEYNKAMCDMLRERAAAMSIDSGKVVGLWDAAIEINVPGIGKGARELVWSMRGKTYSSKAMNVFLRLERLLTMVVENGLTLSTPDTQVETVRMALNILFQTAKASTIEISAEQSAILLELRRRRGHEKGFAEEEIFAWKTGIGCDGLSELIDLKCLRLEDGLVFLNERIML